MSIGFSEDSKVRNDKIHKKVPSKFDLKGFFISKLLLN